MNINVATWGRLLKRSSPSIQGGHSPHHTRSSSESPPSGLYLGLQLGFISQGILTKFDGGDFAN